METIPCIFGHGFSDEVAITENGFQGRRCTSCSTIYISPRPERTEVFDLYSHDKAYVPASHHIGFNPGARLAAQRHFAALHRKHPFSPAAPPKSMLEIGCGGGHLLEIAKRHGIAAHGIELNPFQAKVVTEKLGIPCETVEFTKNSFGTKQFDIIFHCDVTSHLFDPIGDFTAMRGKLTENGWLVFETGNGADVDPKYYKYFNRWQYPDHLFFFGESSIRELLSRAGFSRIHISSRSILPELALLRLLRRLAKRPALKENRNSVTAKTTASLPPLRARIFRTVFAHALDFVKWGIGSRLRNPSHPRTMLIWAAK